MRKMEHGGDWAGFQQEFGWEPLDFSANINPLGVPEGVCRAIARAAAKADRYPDPACRRLVHALAETEQVREDWILCGNGAADLIFRAAAALRPKRALLTAPGFSEYRCALRSVDCRVEYIRLEEKNEFRLQPDILERITPEIDVLFLCEPNNPTGVTTDPDLLEQILRRCGRTGTRVILDECFGDFLDQGERHSARRYLGEMDHLLILKAFTKIYGMAGVRLGYCLCADSGLLARMREAGQPWAVSLLAEEAGLAALKEKEYRRKTELLIREERPWLYRRLEQLGLHPVRGEANYLLFRGSAALGEAMRSRGILIRDCSNYPGLEAPGGEKWYRTAVRSHGENERLAAGLAACLETENKAAQMLCSGGQTT